MIPLPDLPDAYDALEPVLSDAAMRLHPAPLDPQAPLIEDEPAFERALHEASGFLDHPPAADSFHHRRFRQLLGRIADYCDRVPPGVPPRAIPVDFDARLGEAVGRAAEARARANDDHHWGPMVGGDLRQPPGPPHG